MNWTRQQLKSNAKLMIKKNYWLCVLVTLIYSFFTGEFLNQNSSDSSELSYNLSSGNYAEVIRGFLPVIGITLAVLVIVLVLVNIFVGNAIAVGTSRFFLHNIEGQGELNDVAFGFKNEFMNNVKVLFLRDLYVALWSLLLIVPGIIKAYEYYLVAYILAENPGISTDEALSLSKDMMDGEKMNVFVLELSFILWNLLSAITFNIVGVLWVNPYRLATRAELYTAIKARYYGSQPQADPYDAGYTQ